MLYRIAGLAGLLLASCLDADPPFPEILYVEGDEAALHEYLNGNARRVRFVAVPTGSSPIVCGICIDNVRGFYGDRMPDRLKQSRQDPNVWEFNDTVGFDLSVTRAGSVITVDKEKLRADHAQLRRQYDRVGGDLLRDTLKSERYFVQTGVHPLVYMMIGRTSPQLPNFQVAPREARAPISLPLVTDGNRHAGGCAHYARLSVR